MNPLHHSSLIAAGVPLNVINHTKPHQPQLMPIPYRSTSATRLQSPAKPFTAAAPQPSAHPNFSAFDWEYAQLENALRKDSNAPEPGNAMPEKPLKTVAPPLLEPEFYFGDILGDDGVPPQSMNNMIKSEDHLLEGDQNEAATSNVAEFEQTFTADDFRCPSSITKRQPGSSEGTETNLSGALASFVGSDVSAEYAGQHNEKVVNQSCPISVGAQGKVVVGTSIRGVGEPLSQSNVRNNNSEIHGGREVPLYRYITKPDVVSNGKQAGDAGNNMDFRYDDDGKDGSDSMLDSPVSDTSVSGSGIGSHPDLYENLEKEVRDKVDRLREIVTAMPRRKLRESLAKGVTIEDVEPLMCVNRDELAGILGLGVTTWKMFVHHTLGVPRWPARALKSQFVKEQRLLEKRLEAESRGEYDSARRIASDLAKLMEVHKRRRKAFRNDAKMRVQQLSINKKRRS